MGMRPRRCAQARVCPSAKASRYRVASPRAGALYGGGGAPRAVGIRPGKCAQVRLRCSALTFGYAVRLRPVSRRLACGSRRNAPRFMTIDRSLVRPFPHRRYAHRVRVASPLCGAPAPGFAEPCSAVRGPTLLRFAFRLRPFSPRIFIRPRVRTTNVSAENGEALNQQPAGLRSAIVK